MGKNAIYILVSLVLVLGVVGTILKIKQYSDFGNVFLGLSILSMIAFVILAVRKLAKINA